MEKARRDIRALSLDELRRFFNSHSVPAFKGNQVYEWLWSKGSHDFLGMTNFVTGITMGWSIMGACLFVKGMLFHENNAEHCPF